jgi:hypothetical protein
MHFLYTESEFSYIVIYRWMKGAHERARQKAAASASDGETKGISSKTGVVRYSQGMKGWRPSAYPKARNRFGLF